MSEIIDQYYSIKDSTEGQYKEKGSKFISYAYSVTSEEQVEERLEEIRNLHHKARHHCYAYKIGIDGNRYRANDDGELGGTAGKPILGQLHSYKVTDVLVIVVRYFGGTKLGASGLITAYKEAAKNALFIAEKKQVIIGNSYLLRFGYDQMGHVMNCIKSIDLDILDKAFANSCEITINIKISQQTELIHRLKAALLEVSKEQIDDDTKVPFCKIVRIEE